MKFVCFCGCSLGVFVIAVRVHLWWQFRGLCACSLGVCGLDLTQFRGICPHLDLTALTLLLH